jgi:hypothetical protein
MKYDLTEGLEEHDLDRLVHDELHIDEYKSKLGSDEDIIVLSFKVKSKDPALDLVSFIETGYSWVIDSDASSGSMDDGSFIVFVELERTKDAPEQIEELLHDLAKITDIKPERWRIRYGKDRTATRPDKESLTKSIPLTPEDYQLKNSPDDIHKELDQLKSAAGVKVTTKAPKNDLTDSVRIAAGIL